MVSEDIASGKLIPLLDPYRLQNSDREQVNAVFYKSSAAAKRVCLYRLF